MDATAVSLCMENKLPIVVFDLRQEGNIRRVVIGEPIGTLVHGGVAELDVAMQEASHKMEQAVVAPEGGLSARSGPAAPRRPCSAASSVEYYGTQVPLNQLASISVPGAAPAAGPAVRQDGDRGDREGDPGPATSASRPSNDGNVIRLAFPRSPRSAAGSW